MNQFTRKSTMVRSRRKSTIMLSDFKIINQLGRGTFGRVYLAELNGEQFAIKAIRKDVLLEYDQVKNTELEKDIMFQCDHVNLVSMDYLF